MGLLNLIYLESDKVYGCSRCKVHLSEVNEIRNNEMQYCILKNHSSRISD